MVRCGQARSKPLSRTTRPSWRLENILLIRHRRRDVGVPVEHCALGFQFAPALLPRPFAAPILHRINQTDQCGQASRRKASGASPARKQPPDATRKITWRAAGTRCWVLGFVHIRVSWLSCRFSGLPHQAPHRSSCSPAATLAMDKLPREAFGVRPACWRCRKAEVGRKREQAPRTPNASRGPVVAIPFCAMSICLLPSLLGRGAWPLAVRPRALREDRGVRSATAPVRERP